MLSVFFCTQSRDKQVLVFQTREALLQRTIQPTEESKYKMQ